MGLIQTSRTIEMMITNILMSCNLPRTFFSYNWKQFYNFTQNVTYSKFVEFSAISDSCISRIFNRAKINNREYRFYNEQIRSSNTANINMDIYWADIITKILQLVRLRNVRFLLLWIAGVAHQDEVPKRF